MTTKKYAELDMRFRRVYGDVEMLLSISDVHHAISDIETLKDEAASEGNRESFKFYQGQLSVLKMFAKTSRNLRV